jgi:hypothetical protein
VSTQGHSDGRFFAFSAAECCVIGAVVTAVQLGTAFVRGIAETDFTIFHRTTERYLAGRQMYSAAEVDFTPPLFHALLFPLAHLDPRVAFAVWTAANLCLAAIVVMMVVKAVPGADRYRWHIVAWLINSAGVQMALRLGQVSWIAAFLLTGAWLAARASRPRAAGLWAGAAIAFKPFLLLALPVFVVRRQWRTLAWCIGAIALCTALNIMTFGPGVFADWIANLRLRPDPAYATHFLNASLTGLVARAHLPASLAMVASVCLVALTLWRARSASEDHTWLLLSMTAILVTPVGWVYYLPLLLGPLVALIVEGRLVPPRWARWTILVPSLASTQFQQTAVLVAVTMGSVYAWGLIGTFVTALLERRASVCADVPAQRPVEVAAQNG